MWRQIFISGTINGACMLSCFSHVRLFVTLWTVAHQVPLCLGFSRQEYWSELPSRGSSWPKDWTRISWGSCFAGRFFTAEPWGIVGGAGTKDGKIFWTRKTIWRNTKHLDEKVQTDTEVENKIERTLMYPGIQLQGLSTYSQSCFIHIQS